MTSEHGPSRNCGEHDDHDDVGADADCRESLTQLYEFIDGELTAERRALIRSHLDRCGGCLDTYDFEAELRHIVSTCCRERALPPGLKERVAEALQRLPDE